MSLLQKIRSKSDKEKNMISLISAGMVTLIIVILWLGFGNFNQVTETETDLKLSSISPFETLKEQFGDLTSDLKDNFNQISEGLNNLKEVSTTTASSTVENNN